MVATRAAVPWAAMPAPPPRSRAALRRLTALARRQQVHDLTVLLAAALEVNRKLSLRLSQAPASPKFPSHPPGIFWESAASPSRSGGIAPRVKKKLKRKKVVSGVGMSPGVPSAPARQACLVGMCLDAPSAPAPAGSLPGANEDQIPSAHPCTWVRSGSSWTRVLKDEQFLFLGAFRATMCAPLG